MVFWAALFSFASAYPGYSHSHKAISELGALGAPHALWWNLLGFIVPGVLLSICGAGVATAIERPSGKTAVYWLLVLSGVGFAGAGVIPAEMRKKLGIKEGTRIQVELDEERNRIYLTPITREYIHSLRGSLKGKGALKFLEEERRKERG